MIYGYARVSSHGQQLYGKSLDIQEDSLRAAGAETVIRETYTGVEYHRPALDQLMSNLRAGDTLIVAKLDRIARSTQEGLRLIDDLLAKGVSINILNMGKFDNSPSGKLMRTIMLAFAEFERDLIVSRTQEGKAKARQKQDYREGRKPIAYDENLYQTLRDQVDDGLLTVSEAARRLGVSRAKWYRIGKIGM